MSTKRRGLKKTTWQFLSLCGLYVLFLLSAACKKDNIHATACSGAVPGEVISSTRPSVSPSDSALDAKLQDALATKEPKQLWAEDLFPENKEEVSVWHFSRLDCTALCQELLEQLFPDANNYREQHSADCKIVTLKIHRAEIMCTADTSDIRIRGLTSNQIKELLPVATKWFTDRTGLELREWQGHNMSLIPASRVYTDSVDGHPIGVLKTLPVSNKLDGTHGLQVASQGINICSPILVGEQAGTVRLWEQYSPEELRMTAEFSFDTEKPVVEAYRSCELCYLIHEQKGLLIPVWWIKGTQYNYETGKETAIEMVVDAETGSFFDFGGV